MIVTEKMVAAGVLAAVEVNWLGGAAVSDIVRAAIGPALPEMWQTMETAPTDGSYALFYSPGAQNTVVAPNRPFCQVDRFHGSFGEFAKQFPEAPYTHWMPIVMPKDEV